MEDPEDPTRPRQNEPAPTPAPLVTFVNGSRVNFAGQGPVIALGGTTMIPVVEIMQLLGFQSQWDAATQTATFTRNREVITVTADSRQFTVHGVTRTHENQNAQIINGYLMAPFTQLMSNIGVRAWRDEDNALHFRN